MKIGHRAGHPDQGLALPGGDQQIGVIQHALQGGRMVQRPSRTQRGLRQQRRKLRRGDGVVNQKCGGH